MNTLIKYRTFDELLNEVATDFTMYNNEGLIEPSQLIKIAQKINYDLGLKIHGTKEKVLDIEKRKTKLPTDFYTLNHAHLCGSYRIETPVMHGRHTENVILDSTTCRKCGNLDENCSCEKTYTVECKTGEKIFVQVREERKHEIKVYETFERIHIATSTGRIDALDDSRKTAYIKNGFIYTNVDQGKIYISYQGTLEDDDGNLLVLDHPVINEYYEYAIKQRLLENLYINGEDVAQKIQMIEPRYKAARNNALSIVNTPDFADMKQLWETNRKAQYSKYYNMFKSIEQF